MSRAAGLAMALALFVAACQSSPAPTTFGGDASRFFAIEEVGLGPDGYVSLLNYTAQPASLKGLRLCQPPTCVALPDTTVQPGAAALIAAGDGSGLEHVAVSGADLALTPAAGEVALFAAGQLNDPSNIRAYLEWGSTPHAATATAVEAGLWRDGTYAPSAENATRLYKTDANLWVFDTQ